MTDRNETRAVTHADDCWSWGPGHYDCAVREIERLRDALEGCHALSVERWKRLLAAEAENKRLRSIISDIKDWDCDVRGGFLSIPVGLRRRIQDALATQQQGGRADAR